MKVVSSTSLYVLFSCFAIVAVRGAEVTYDRDVRPILSDNCFACHGPDENAREGELRLDHREGVAESAIIPGKANLSEVILRITTKNEGELMPPAESHRSRLSAKEVGVLKHWINEGAVYQNHWSFERIERPVVPHTKNSNWVKTPIDAFVLARLESAGLVPSKKAAPETLAKRLSYDLTGLPPDLDQIQSLVEGIDESNYGRLVKGLLASHHYGERMAMVWLDGARFSDTDGFQADATRANWPWRDWVVDAYNTNMPFDEFTRLQFAGDLLTSATPDQILATTFHRNHMTNGEGGRDPEESRVDYVIDRVNTMGTVWMGLTLGCAQCHSHKFDPISQSEYYSLNAFFNSVDEDGKAGKGAKPFLSYTSPYAAASETESRSWLALKIKKSVEIEAQADVRFQVWQKQLESSFQGKTPEPWRMLKASRLLSREGNQLEQQVDGVISVFGKNTRHADYVVHAKSELKRVTGFRLTLLPELEGGFLSLGEGGHVTLTNLKVSRHSVSRNQLEEVEVKTAVVDYEGKKKGSKDYGAVKDVLDDDPRTGWSSKGADPKESRVMQFEFEEPLVLLEGEELVLDFRHRSLQGNANMRRFMVELTDQRGPGVTQIIESPVMRLWKEIQDGKRLSAEVKKQLREQFLEDDQPYQLARLHRTLAANQLSKYQAAAKPQKVMVMAERETQRKTHLLVRGSWENPAEEVKRSTPKSLNPWPEDSGKTRLGLAEWLTHRDHPLTARVTINRYWQMYFGNGLVRTPEDFGAQGEVPSHPDLLDWLAAEFIESGWDIKHIQKLIVSSATYQQSSNMRAGLAEVDPLNKLLARQNRFRLPAWMIRDGALKTGEMLNTRPGGPPVFAWQPVGLWLDSTMGRFRYSASVGGDLYRRSIYSFWRRSVGPPNMFDASKRRVCVTRVIRTSTPLQALTLMNDETYIEASHQLGKKISKTHGDSVSRLTELFRSVTGRKPKADELETLSAQYKEAKTHFLKHRDDAMAFLSVGQMGGANEEAAPEQASLALVASTLLNLDETITRE
ncbi:PSD1 and planctomycete cytochrome C domain-containing protein [Verrucomicrobia bacterium]|nr:PSD1 and planctomycete cytochrome C domain-containing protein [Verrucomicrobiota bacterium]